MVLYISRLKQILSQLQGMGFKYSKEQIIHQLLNGLDAKFTEQKKHMLNTANLSPEDTLTFEKVQGALRTAEVNIDAEAARTGKTKAAKIIAGATGAIHLWADKERHERFGEVYSQAQSDELYQHLNNEAANLLSSGNDVVFDTNFNYFKDREHLRTIGAASGAETKVIWVRAPKELAYQRAIAEPQGKRMFVTMSHEDFERVASHLEPPRVEEHAIEIDGTHIDPKVIKQQLGI